jgi:methyl-accepting chemotaxis protein
VNGEVLEVLRQIREETKGTNARLDQTNARLDQTVGRLDQTVGRLDQTVGRLDQTISRLDSVDARLQLVEGKVDFLSRSMIKGFADVRETLDDHAEQIQRLVAGQTEAMNSLRDVIAAKFDDRALLLNHEQRIQALEQRP